MSDLLLDVYMVDLTTEEGGGRLLVLVKHAAILHDNVAVAVVSILFMLYVIASGCGGAADYDWIPADGL